MGIYRKKSHIIYSVIFIVALLLNNLLSDNISNTGNYPLTVKYIDVKQGDSSLIILPDNRTILIDAGEEKYSDNVIREIDSLNIRKIDYLIATHPHTDHIGGMERIVNKYEIGKIYMPRAEHTSRTYIDLLEAISEKNLKINSAKSGVIMIDEPDIKAEFLSPIQDHYDEINNYSAILRLTYKDTSFLFCGDAEKLVEKEVLASGFDVSADVLKVGHHGSSGSTSDAFLDAVNPHYAVISCGRGNEYGHPHREIISKLQNITVFRTDKSGTITLYSDGINIKEHNYEDNN